MKLIKFFKLDRTRKYMEKDIEEDKTFFQNRKKCLYDDIRFIYGYRKNINNYSYEENEMNQYIKDKLINEKDKKYIYEISRSLDCFILYRFGVSYSLFDKNHKDKLVNGDLSYESIKNLSYEVTENNIEDCKKELPEIVHECLKDYCFLMFCQTKENPKIDRTNFLLRIRDYFILDLDKADFEGVRNEKTYEEIKSNMKNIYGQLKEQYGGKNPYYEKFLSYFSKDTDYNYPETTKILNDYYKIKKNNKNNKNINGYMPIKQNEE